MMGLIILLKDHGGAQDLAVLADDLELEIDEILPAVEFAKALGYVVVTDGHVQITDSGKALVAAKTLDRKVLLREKLSTLGLLSQILHALNNSPEGKLTGEQLADMVARVALPSENTVDKVIAWGRYTDMFRYSREQDELRPSLTKVARTKPPAKRTGV